MSARAPLDSPLPNAAFYPEASAGAAPELYGVLRIAPARMRTLSSPCSGARSLPSSVRGIHRAAGRWDMLRSEVLEPIGIAQAAAVRTPEPRGGRGVVWLNAGYYPTRDDLGKIAMLYQNLGAGESEVILYPSALVSIRIGKAACLPAGEAAVSGAGPETIRAVDRLCPL